MDDLVAFIEARLAEDQERAERGQWTAEFLSQGGRRDPGSKRAYAKDIEREGGYSPARVLREVKAKRRVLALHAETDGRCSTCHQEADMQVFYDSDTETETVEWVRRAMPFPCPTLLLLALPFAEHPDFRPEWSPTDA